MSRYPTVHQLLQCSSVKIFRIKDSPDGCNPAYSDNKFMYNIFYCYSSNNTFVLKRVIIKSCITIALSIKYFV